MHFCTIQAEDHNSATEYFQRLPVNSFSASCIHPFLPPPSPLQFKYVGVCLLGEFQVVLSAVELPPTHSAKVLCICSTAWSKLILYLEHLILYLVRLLLQVEPAAKAVWLKDGLESSIPNNAAPKRRGVRSGQEADCAETLHRNKVSETQALLSAI